MLRRMNLIAKIINLMPEMIYSILQKCCNNYKSDDRNDKFIAAKMINLMTEIINLMTEIKNSCCNNYKSDDRNDKFIAAKIINLMTEIINLMTEMINLLLQK
eukprot:GHVP01028326.1.p1 GENE.GHVP01028326.1~~GHVP01028326.1.p1  ORF type:complete len:102 (+),score=22.04 GHVP01028326.1:130-435(+)